VSHCLYLFFFFYMYIRLCAFVHFLVILLRIVFLFGVLAGKIYTKVVIIFLLFLYFFMPMLLTYCNLYTYNLGFFFFGFLWTRYFGFAVLIWWIFFFFFNNAVCIGYYTFDEIFVYTFVFLCHLGFYLFIFFGSHVFFHYVVVFLLFIILLF
jgi:hypothetical protein